MEFIQNIVQLNRDVIYFGYGLVFFVLGLAIALQSRNYSRLDLARSLKWLSAFGFAHGFYEWGDLFIPIQTAYLNARTIETLHYFHLLLLAGSFAFLFEFGELIATAPASEVAAWRLCGVVCNLVLCSLFSPTIFNSRLQHLA